MTRVVHVNDRIEGAVYIGRAMGGGKRRAGSWFGNPFRIGVDGDRATVIAKYREWILGDARYSVLRRVPELRGLPLACWCRYDGESRTAATACHGDVLVELLERYTDDELRAMGGQGA